MIKMIKGVYGLKMNGAIKAMTSRSAPFSLPASREAELVAADVAEYIEEPQTEDKEDPENELQGTDSAGY